MNPRRVALTVAAAYLAPSLIYIYISSTIVADVAVDAEQAATIEILKGLAFVTFSALLIGGITWKILRRLDNQRRRARRMREELLEARAHHGANLLAASLAHDINNELTVLRSNNNVLLRRDNVDDWIQELSEDQAVAIDSLLDLLERLDNSVLQQDLTATCDLDLADLTKSTIDSLRSHSLLENCALRIDIDVDSSRIHGAPALLRQALVNLVFNAAQATDAQGTIEVDLCSPDDTLLLQVHDDGPGVPPDERHRIFDAFVTGRKQGSGLGLFSVRACAEAHGGNITVDDSSLGGALFSLELPADSNDSVRLNSALASST